MEVHGSRTTLRDAEQTSDALIRGKEQGVEATLEAISRALGVSADVLRAALSRDTASKAVALAAISVAAGERASEAVAERKNNPQGEEASGQS